MGDADRIGKLQFTLIRKAGSHQVLRRVSGCVSRGTVHLRAVLSRESAAAVTGISAVRINNNLPSSQAAVAVGAADHETPCGIDKEFRILIHHLRRKHLVENIFLNIRVNLLLGHRIIMLRRQNNGVQPAGLSVFIILHRYLRLPVRAQITKRAVFTDLGQPPRQLMGKGDGIRHKLRRFVGGVSEHHSLVAGADRVQFVLCHRILPRLQRLIDAHGNIRRLLVDRDDHAAGITVKAIFCPVITDFPYRLPNDLLNIHIRAGGDFSHNHYQARRRAGLAGNPTHGILLHQRV